MTVKSLRPSTASALGEGRSCWGVSPCLVDAQSRSWDSPTVVTRGRFGQVAGSLAVAGALLAAWSAFSQQPTVPDQHGQAAGTAPSAVAPSTPPSSLVDLAGHVSPSEVADPAAVLRGCGGPCVVTGVIVDPATGRVVGGEVRRLLP